MFKIILLIIIPIYIFAYEFKLNSEDIQYIKESPKKKHIINRIYKYQQLKNNIKNFSEKKKLYHINSYINKILHSSDKNTSGLLDHWATPKEFLINGFGDCEDYAIAKYFTLLELGFNKKNLYLANVNVKGYKKSHMVLLYYTKNNTALVLDSLSFKILPLNKRSDIKANYAFNEYKTIKLNKNHLSNKVAMAWHKSHQWNRVLKKSYSTIQ